MPSILGLAEAAARFAAAAADIEAAKRAALEEACQMVEARAKGLIGHPNAQWPPLSAETIAHKAGLNMPLLETGEMRDSIEHTVIDSSYGEVGSNLDRAVWQELGTNRGIPPRPFLSLAAQLEGPAIAKVVEKTVGRAIGAGLAGHRVSDFFEIAHMLGEALHPVKEMGEDLLTPDEEQRTR